MKMQGTMKILTNLKDKIINLHACMHGPWVITSCNALYSMLRLLKNLCMIE